jgi:structure-specific endonuclease subunit SLX1
MCLLVHGFPSKIAALMFEHAWQHCYMTRHIKKEDCIVSSKTGGRSLAHKLGNVRLLCKSQFFTRMQLKVQCFSSECYKVWCENRFGITVSDSIQVSYVSETKRDEQVNMGHVTDFKQKYQDEDSELLERYGKLLTFGELTCGICQRTVDYANGEEFPLLGLCHNCECVSHLSCLARDHCSEELIPQRALCPGCTTPSPWPLYVRRATRVREKFGLPSESLEH